MFICSHGNLSRPFWTEEGIAYKCCLDCGKHVRAAMWDATAPGMYAYHRTQDRKVELTPISGIERMELGVRN